MQTNSSTGGSDFFEKCSNNLIFNGFYILQYLKLLNLKRANSPFNFLVVDTPNQQGQDEENLENIFKSLQFFLSDDGQVIIGSERKTGLEEKENTILELTEKRRCLTQEKYTEHTRLLKQLYQATVEWHSKTQ